MLLKLKFNFSEKNNNNNCPNHSSQYRGISQYIFEMVLFVTKTRQYLMCDISYQDDNMNDISSI